MPNGTRKTGEFCWFNMLTPAAARDLRMVADRER
jgi:hypothetical protein